MSELTDIDLGDTGPRISGNQRGALWLEMKALTRLAAPLAATQLAQMLILATDTLLLGHLNKEALAAAKEALGANDLNLAAQIFGMVLQAQPENAEAIIGMARVYLKAGEPEQAQAVLGTLKEPQPKNEDYTSLVAALKLASEASELSAIAELQQTVERNPDDHQSRYDLALALNAEGKRVEAAEQLVALMKRDREWNEDGARKKLLEFFEAWGFKDPATIKGRRLLSSLLFS